MIIIASVVGDRAAVATALAAAVGVVIYFFQARIMNATRKAQVFQHLYEWYRRPGSQDLLGRILRGERVHEREMDGLLGWLEYFSILIDAGLIQESLARKILGYSPVKVAYRTQLYWQKRRSADYPRYAWYLERMVLCWQSKLDAAKYGYGSNSTERIPGNGGCWCRWGSLVLVCFGAAAAIALFGSMLVWRDAGRPLLVIESAIIAVAGVLAGWLVRHQM